MGFVGRCHKQHLTPPSSPPQSQQWALSVTRCRGCGRVAPGERYHVLPLFLFFQRCLSPSLYEKLLFAELKKIILVYIQKKKKNPWKCERKRKGVNNLTWKLMCWPDFHCKTNHWRKHWMAKFTHHKLQRFQESTWQTPSLFTLEHLEELGLPTKIITSSSLYTKLQLEYLKQMQI